MKCYNTFDSEIDFKKWKDNFERNGRLLNLLKKEVRKGKIKICYRGLKGD